MKYIEEFYGFIGNYFTNEELENINLEVINSLSSSDWQKWEKVLDSLPVINPSILDLNSDAIVIGQKTDASTNEINELKLLLKELMPWRKGPIEFFGIKIDTEWHSDWKWNRLKNHIKPLNGKAVLDIGSGNGYFALRMYGAGAKTVVGLDSYLLYTAQFLAMRKYLGTIPVWIVPMRFEHFPKSRHIFDTVFSMGVLYHQKEPLKHLSEIYQLLKPNGELVLETIIIDEEYGNLLQPNGRYAKMRNVRNIPSISLLTEWIRQIKYKNVRVIDVSVTTVQEQRKTEWMVYESLPDFLDTNDNTKTIEGYPAPKRAIVLAEK